MSNTHSTLHTLFSFLPFMLSEDGRGVGWRRYGRLVELALCCSEVYVEHGTTQQPYHTVEGGVSRVKLQHGFLYEYIYFGSRSKAEEFVSWVRLLIEQEDRKEYEFDDYYREEDDDDRY